MRVISDIISIRTAIKNLLSDNKSVGLVPTMGALHEGHLSLVKESVKTNDYTVATIFVNPLQFNNPEDLDNYPVSIDDDLRLLEAYGCNLIFVPSKEVMYKVNPVTSISLGYLEETMEGKHRPGHFQGVALVVLKLFNILNPTVAYFGQKDLQQYRIIEKMVQDISLDIQLRMIPTVREDSGLAMSSRNRRLTDRSRKTAAEIYRALALTSDAIKHRDSIEVSLGKALDHISNHPDIQIEYLELVKLEDLMPVKSLSESDQLALCFAGYVDNIRLIDNLIIDLKE
ncbi:MAG: pantoate--beta-alanine ligase [Bacteroidota bacterium]